MMIYDFRIPLKKNSPVILSLCLVSKYRTKYSEALSGKRNKRIIHNFMELNTHIKDKQLFIIFDEGILIFT